MDGADARGVRRTAHRSKHGAPPSACLSTGPPWNAGWYTTYLLSILRFELWCRPVRSGWHDRATGSSSPGATRVAPGPAIDPGPLQRPAFDLTGISSRVRQGQSAEVSPGRFRGYYRNIAALTVCPRRFIADTSNIQIYT